MVIRLLIPLFSFLLYGECLTTPQPKRYHKTVPLVLLNKNLHVMTDCLCFRIPKGPINSESYF